MTLSCRPKCPAIAGSLFSQLFSQVTKLGAFPEIIRDFSTPLEMTRCRDVAGNCSPRRALPETVLRLLHTWTPRCGDPPTRSREFKRTVRVPMCVGLKFPVNNVLIRTKGLRLQPSANPTNSWIHGRQSRYASWAPICKLVFPGEWRSNWAASHWNHSNVFCEPLRCRSSST